MCYRVYVCVCVRECVCAHIHMWVCSCMEMPEDNLQHNVSHSRIIQFSEMEFANMEGWLDSEFQMSNCLHYLSLGLQARNTKPDHFSIQVLSWNSGPCVCKASTLSTQLLSWSFLFLKSTNTRPAFTVITTHGTAFRPNYFSTEHMVLFIQISKWLGPLSVAGEDGYTSVL